MLFVAGMSPLSRQHKTDVARFPGRVRSERHSGQSTIRSASSADVLKHAGSGRFVTLSYF
jgi:hypothetical protein